MEIDMITMLRWNVLLAGVVSVHLAATRRAKTRKECERTLERGHRLHHLWVFHFQTVLLHRSTLDLWLCGVCNLRRNCVWKNIHFSQLGQQLNVFNQGIILNLGSG
jgi:hypothetical protein